MRRILAAIVTAAGLAVLAPAGPAHSATPLYLANTSASSTAYCATPLGNSTENGAIVTLWQCVPGAAPQMWHWQGNQLVNDASGKCMTPQGDAYNTDGAVLTLWTCVPGSKSQQFGYDPTGWIANYYSGKALTPRGDQMANGVYLTLWTYVPTSPQQRWGFYYY
ncbi:RICIN domain-containing protein [Kitasatospora sp. NPDC004531]